ncbi:MAG: hypothetical protein JXA11_16675 [Phycisphaerae bacterium]|nr:hypothetical protein [Phycisphaerae bacterium]
MKTPPVEQSDDGTSCDACGGCGHSHDMPRIAPGDGLTGWPLAIAAFFVFLLPVGLAILGAAMIGRDPNSQLLGATAGFVVGMILAGAATRVLKRKGKHNTDFTD